MSINIDNALFYQRELRQADANFNGVIDSSAEVEQALRLILNGKNIDDLPAQYRQVLRRFADSQGSATAFNGRIDQNEVNSALAKLSEYYETKEGLLKDFVFGTNDNMAKDIAPGAPAAPAPANIPTFAAMLNDIDKVMPEIWEYYKTAKIDQATGRPVGDNDYTFSETVSYVMLRSLDLNDRATFDRVWNWAYQNLYRNSDKLQTVFSALEGRNVPAARRDNLFSWRYLGRQTNNSSIDQLMQRFPNLPPEGVIYDDWKAYDNSWNDGYDAAPDADVLIAYCLFQAAQKWGSGHGAQDYAGVAQKMLPDIWQKCVVYGQIGGQNVPLPLESIWSHNENTNYLLLDNAQKAEITYVYKPEDQTAKRAQGLPSNSYNGIWGLFGLGLKDLSGDYEKVRLTITNNGTADCLPELIFQVDENEDYGCKTTNPIRPGETKTIEVKVADLRKRAHSGAWSYTSAPVPARTAIANFAIQCDIGAKITVANIQLVKKPEKVQKPEEHRYFLSANDKKSRVFNLSYFMPFAIQTFIRMDKNSERKWAQLLADSYTLIDYALDRRVPYPDAKAGEDVYYNNGALAPDWSSFTNDGIGSAVGTWDSFRSSSVQDTHLSSWDALRLYVWAAYSYVQHNDQRAKILLDKAGKFFADELNKNNWIYNAYNVDGTVPPDNRRGATDKGTPFGMAIALAVFCALDNKTAALQIYNLLKAQYQNGRFCAAPDDYFTSNILAFALNLFKLKYQN